MRARTILIVSGATLALAACHPPYFHHRGHDAYKTVTALDCPPAQGDLSRKSVSPDGKSCDYTSGDGSAVTLRLVSLTGTTADSALSPLETSLRAEVPATDTGDGKGPGEGRVDIDLPGIHIHAAGKDGDKDSGEVKIGRGISIGAGNTVISDGGDGGGVDIDAHDKGAEIRVNEGHGGTRRDLILAADAPGPHGYRVAGYEARGPQGGPLVVASLLAKTDDHDRISHDIRALVRLNVGG
jgi:hypothetical protein